jgi:hypothetical protein
LPSAHSKVDTGDATHDDENVSISQFGVKSKGKYNQKVWVFFRLSLVAKLLSLSFSLY